MEKIEKLKIVDRIRQEHNEAQKSYEEQQQQEMLNEIENVKEALEESKDLIHDLIESEEYAQANEEVVKCIKKFFHVCSIRGKKKEMWIYSKGIYVPFGEAYISEFARKLLGKSFNDRNLNEIKLKLESDTFIDAEKFFNSSNIEEIPLMNGILNIFDNQLKPFTHEKVFFNKLPIYYVPGADCPKIKQFFKDILKHEEDIKLMYELFAYILFKEYRLERAFMFVGKARNGKSKLLSLIRRFVGVENTCSIPLSQMKEDSKSVWLLHGKLVNLGGDLSNNSLKETGMFKNLIGRDSISAQRKYRDDLNFVNYAKLLFACNELPRVYDTTDGFWDKWILLDFPYKFIPKKEYDKIPEYQRTMFKIRDEGIIDKISTSNELSGLLNKALEELPSLLSMGEFSYTISSREIKEMWIRKSDSFQAYCLDHLESNPNAAIRKRDLRFAFNKYCKFHNLKGSSDKGIKATLQEMHGASEARRIVEGIFEHIWVGIQFKDEEKLNFCLNSLDNEEKKRAALEVKK